MLTTWHKADGLSHLRAATLTLALVELKTVQGYIQLIRVGRKWRGIQGHSTQLDGDSIVDAEGVWPLPLWEGKWEALWLNVRTRNGWPSCAD